MKKCNRCGVENKDESNFCQNCGTSLNGSKPDYISNKKFTERFMNSNIFIRIIVIIFLFIIISFIIVGASYMGFADSSLPTEEDATSHLYEFNRLDIDGDGALSYYEVKDLTPDIAHDDLSFIFNDVDNNKNGVLKGGEFDGYLSSIERHYKNLEEQQKAENEKTSSSSSSSSYSIPAVKSGRCPVCGSDDDYMHEYYDEFDHPYYRCTVCDYITYDEGEFY